MKLLTLLAASLLPAGLLAAPSPDDNDEGGTTGLFSNADGGNRDVEVKKWTVHPCTIVTEKTVNCRAAASTKAPVVAKLPNGLVGGFLCVETGDCVVIGGNKNCGWDRLYYFGKHCYVSGHYTDKDCGVAKLGKC